MRFFKLISNLAKAAGELFDPDAEYEAPQPKIPPQIGFAVSSRLLREMDGFRGLETVGEAIVEIPLEQPGIKAFAGTLAGSNESDRNHVEAAARVLVTRALESQGEEPLNWAPTHRFFIVKDLEGAIFFKIHLRRRDDE